MNANHTMTREESQSLDNWLEHEWREHLREETPLTFSEVCGALIVALIICLLCAQLPLRLLGVIS
jgi:hypothetical protein